MRYLTLKKRLVVYNAIKSKKNCKMAHRHGYGVRELMPVQRFMV